MTSLTNHQSNEYAKVLLIGDAKTRKTSALASLVKDGYKLRILDFDNLLDVLKGIVLKDCPDLADNVEFRTLRDKRKSSPLGPIIDGQPKAFVNGTKMLDHWKYTFQGQEIDYGRPDEWGGDCILVIDSLSRLCDAAYDFRDPLTPVGKSGEKDARATYGDAQDAIESILAHLTSPNFKTNVIVIAHIVYMETDKGPKGFPQGVGQKLSPKIPQYFPTVIRADNLGDKFVLRTAEDRMIDLANPKPFEMSKEYPNRSGLAKIFRILRGDPPGATASIPEEEETQSAAG